MGCIYADWGGGERVALLPTDLPSISLAWARFSQTGPRATSRAGEIGQNSPRWGGDEQLLLWILSLERGHDKSTSRGAISKGGGEARAGQADKTEGGGGSDSGLAGKGQIHCVQNLAAEGCKFDKLRLTPLTIRIPRINTRATPGKVVTPRDIATGPVRPKLSGGNFPAGEGR